MLYRKTTTAFSAVILGVIALLGATAHAQINLSNTGRPGSLIGTATFSKETLPRTTRQTGASQTYYAVKVSQASQNAGNLMSLLGAIAPMNASPATNGFGGIAVRYDLGPNLRFNTALTVAQLVLQQGDGTTIADAASGGATRGLRAGGTATAGSNSLCNGFTCAIFEIDPNVTLLADTRIWLLTWNNTLAVSADGGGQVRVRVYRNYDDALAAGGFAGSSITGLRSDTGAKTAIDVKSSVTTRITPGTPAVADVAADPRFTNFAPAGTKPLGGISISLPPATAPHWIAQATDDNEIVDMLSEVMSTADSGIAFTDSTENLGFGTFRLATAATCLAAGAGRVTVADMGDNIGQGTAAVFTDARTLCVTPRTTATTPAAVATSPNFEIPVTSIMASVSYAPVTGNAFAPADAAGVVGSIVRNGATTQLSYLTVSDRYNQRIIITNRSKADAEYELTNFYTEDGTEASGGEDVMGVVPAETSMVVLTRDAVQFTGSRARGSATLAVTAPAGSISVATTQVNLSDGSTDTINYEVTGAGG